MKKNRNETKRNEKEGNEMVKAGEKQKNENRRRLEFTATEEYNGKNHIDLREDGGFSAIYLFPEERIVAGWWRPSKEMAEKLGLDTERRIYRAHLHYIPADEEKEKRLLDKIGVYAYEFLYMIWKDWYFELIPQFDFSSKEGEGA